MTDEPNKSNRRDFLKGQSAIDAIRAKTDSDKSESVSGSERQRLNNRQVGYLEQYSKNAMGCEFELLFNLHQYSQSGSAAMEAFQLVDLLEDQMTVYREHSAISHMNRDAYQEAIEVEERLFELLTESLQIYQRTNRAFDITSSPLSNAWGFDKRQGSVPTQARIDEILDRVGSSHIDLDQRSKTIKFTKSGVGINLGGIGKGHALDRVAELFSSKNIHDFVIHGGQSSVFASGSSTEPAGKSADKKTSVDENCGNEAENESPANKETRSVQGWNVGLSHPTVPGVRLGEITLRNQALGTSGSGRQGFFHQGKRFGHIIDPRTGWPTDHFLSTTVITDSAALSDALATAFFVMQPEEVAAYCDSTPSVSAILVFEDENRKGQLVVERFNVSDDDFSLND